jgi:large subunit ribosomal protein L17
MRHRKSATKLGKSSSHRTAMLRNMVTSLLKHERIRTTDAKAKVLRGWADHLITLAKRGDLHARRQALAIVQEEAVVHKLFADAAERFGGAAGGYTRIVKVGPRPGDAAPMSLIELVVPEGQRRMKPARKKAAAPVLEKAKTAVAAAGPAAAPADEVQHAPEGPAADDGAPTPGAKADSAPEPKPE